MVEAEESVLRNVLKQLFRREITNEDGKRVVKVFESGNPYQYKLVVDGIEVGIVIIGTPDTCVFDVLGDQSFGVRFEPNEIYR